jgi:hypothetical protein
MQSNEGLLTQPVALHRTVYTLQKVVGIEDLDDNTNHETPTSSLSPTATGAFAWTCLAMLTASSTSGFGTTLLPPWSFVKPFRIANTLSTMTASMPSLTWR